jgi:hypothetical protein
VLSSFVWPSSGCTTRSLPVFLYILRLCSAQRVRAVWRAIEPGALRPSMDRCGHIAVSTSVAFPANGLGTNIGPCERRGRRAARNETLPKTHRIGLNHLPAHPTGREKCRGRNLGGDWHTVLSKRSGSHPLRRGRRGLPAARDPRRRAQLDGRGAREAPFQPIRRVQRRVSRYRGRSAQRQGWPVFGSA